MDGRRAGEGMICGEEEPIMARMAGVTFGITNGRRGWVEKEQTRLLAGQGRWAAVGRMLRCS